MPKHTDKTKAQRKQAELDDILAANHQRYERMKAEYGDFTVNPDANLTVEFIQYLEEIGVITDEQGTDFGIKHANKVTEEFIKLEEHFKKRIKAARAAQFSAPDARKGGLIMPPGVKQ
jgi:hypothetical protein